MKLSLCSLLASAGALVVVGCSSGGSTTYTNDGGADAATDDHPMAALCRMTCSAPVKAYRPCADLDVEACVEACKLQTNGLGATCARCIVENMSFAVKYCDGCATCTGASGGRANACGKTPVGACCSEADESCSEARFPKMTDAYPCGAHCS